MKKLIFILFACLFIANQAFAVTDVKTATGSTSIAVATTATVYTRSFRIDKGEYGVVSYYAYSATGSVNITIELEQAYDVPTTEGSADAAYVEPIDFSDIVTNLTTEST